MPTVEALCRILGSAEEIPASGLASRYGTARAAGTAIYYLLTPDTFSAMPRLASDEIFHFYLGDPVEMLHLHLSHRIILIGPNLEAGQRPQVIVPRDVWQGARLSPRRPLRPPRHRRSPRLRLRRLRNGPAPPPPGTPSHRNGSNTGPDQIAE